MMVLRIMEMNIGSMFELNANRFPDLETVIFEGIRSTSSEIRDRANQRAGALLSLA